MRVFGVIIRKKTNKLQTRKGGKRVETTTNTKTLTSKVTQNTADHRRFKDDLQNGCLWKAASGSRHFLQRQIAHTISGLLL